MSAAEPDLVLLDLRLPDIDGFEVCRRLRERSRVPIIVVSARGEEVDRVVGLELGADDYIVKPYGLRELVARIHAVMRRLEPRAGDVTPMRVDGLVVDRRARRVTLDGDPAPAHAARVRPARVARVRPGRCDQPGTDLRGRLGDALVRVDEDD